MNFTFLNVSLTYLRGLEVTELKEEDIPMVYRGIPNSVSQVWGFCREGTHLLHTLT
jgi:hypothetical protein